MLSVPKRLRYFMQRDGVVLSMVLRIFLRVIAQVLTVHCLGAAHADKAALHIGAVAFIHRLGSSLNEHVHFHVCVVDGVFEEVAGDVVADGQSCVPSVTFHPATAMDAHVVAQAQDALRRRILRAFVGRGLLESVEGKEMLGYQHSHPITMLGVWAAEVFQRTQRWLLAAKIRLDGGERVYQRLGRW